MLGTHVLSDLEIESIQIPTVLSWGNTCFQTTLQSPTSTTKSLKKRQLALFALRHKDAAVACNSLRTKLESMQKSTAIVDECESPVDPRIQETIEQIYWDKDAFGAILNDKQLVVSSLVFWKTLVLPTIAVLVPLLAIVIPFFLIRFFHGIDLSPSTYMTQLRTILLKQISIPPLLRAKHEADIIGYMLETGFLALTAVTYISGIWSQITASMHLRTIAVGLREKGEAIGSMINTFAEILDTLHELPDRLQKALHPFLLQGEKVLANLTDIPNGCGYRTYGYLWNHRDALTGLKAWIGELDAMLGIVAIPDITFPTYTGPLIIEGVYHPTLSRTRIPNTVSWSSLSHAIVTGPNRGGKSTLCRSIGLSLLCAQSWGFAFATRMSFTPFQFIETALHPADTLGELSLFEAEIEFAKSVLAKEGRMFVMMDEIFHSTNAIDGLAASRVFLSQLFRLPGVTSLISTHYKELPAEFGESAIAWAMDAKEGPTGLLEYSYRLVKGISDKSSVMEILRERGLIGAAA